jgi:glucokinase
MVKHTSVQQALKAISQAEKRALTRVQGSSQTQQITLISTLVLGVLVGVGVAVWVANRTPKKVSDTDESGDPLFV